jgi:hypothetical protein
VHWRLEGGSDRALVINQSGNWHSWSLTTLMATGLGQRLQVLVPNTPPEALTRVMCPRQIRCTSSRQGRCSCDSVYWEPWKHLARHFLTYRVRQTTSLCSAGPRLQSTAHQALRISTSTSPTGRRTTWYRRGVFDRTTGCHGQRTMKAHRRRLWESSG